MAPLLFALVGSFLLSIGARDQLLVAHLRERLGPSYALLAVGVASAIATAAIAAWAGAQLAPRLSESAAPMFVAIALGVAAIELAWPIRPPSAQEPTRSLGAISLVMFARQITDAARFLVLALAVALADPELAGTGGALGGAAAVALGWSGAIARADTATLTAVRRVLAAILACVALWLGLSVRGIVG